MKNIELLFLYIPSHETITFSIWTPLSISSQQRHFQVYIFLHIEALIIRGGCHAFFPAFVVLDCALAGLLRGLHLWVRAQ